MPIVAVTPVPVNAMTDAPSKFVPVIVAFTRPPCGPEVGMIAVMVGAGTVTVNMFALVAVPAGVVTVMKPLVAPAGTAT